MVVSLHTLSMTSITPVSAAEAQQRIARKCKTSTLRDALLEMAPGDIVFIPFLPTENGYKASTAIQAIGTVSRAHPTNRFSVRRDTERTGAFVFCLERTSADEADEATLPKATKPKGSKSSKAKPAEAAEAAEAAAAPVEAG